MVKQKKQSAQAVVSADVVVQEWIESCPERPELAEQQLSQLREHLAAALQAAAEAERAACLKIAEQEVEVWADIASDGGQEAARGIANFIRGRAKG